MPKNNQKNVYIFVIAALVICISILHYSTSTHHWQYHLIYMQAYFIPIILAAFQFGIRGGLGAALVVSAIYFPHIMMQWGGLVENNLMRFSQIILFNVLGYLTGLKAQGERAEKEKYQETARKLEKALANQVEQSEQLAEMEQSLRSVDRLAVVGELTASLAHEVRNPLGSIRGAVEIIRNAVPEEVKKNEFFDILIEDTNRLNRVVENYLRFAGKPVKFKSKFDLIKSLRNSIMMIAPQARKQSVIIHSSFADGPLLTKGNPDQFWQVCMNILLNALQAIEGPGEVRVQCHLEGEDMAIVKISDTGKGIGAETAEKIFKPFYTTRNRGTGLGLAIVKRNCDENGWKISMQSQPGEGTVVEIEIPV